MPLAGSVFASGVSKACRCGQRGEKHCRGVCQPCYQKQKAALDPSFQERKQASRRAYYYRTRQARIKAACEWNVRNKDKRYLIAVKGKYGLTSGEHKDLHDMQQGRCAICRVPESALPTRLCVDHDHVTGDIRGLFCRSCNAGLGVHERAGTDTYGWYLRWTPMMRLKKMKTLTDEERALWNW